MTPPLVVALDAHALSERGWPTFADDPDAATERAARSIAFVARYGPVVVAHCLAAPTAERLRRQLETLLGRPVRSTAAGLHGDSTPTGDVVLCMIGDVDDCPDDAASDLAVALDAEMLVLLADVPVVRDGPATDDSSRAIRIISSGALDDLEVDDAHAAALDAARRFVETTGRTAAVGSIDHLEAMVAGDGGTRVRDGDDEMISFYGPPAQST